MYGKHFASMYTGSMMASGPEVFAVWGYVIANAMKSTVELNPAYLAAVIGSTPERMQEAIDKLCEADPHSRNCEHDGCRLIKEGGFQYFVPSHERYRTTRNEDDRRAYFREKKRESRARLRASKTVKDSPRHSKVSTQAEAEAEAEALKTCIPPPSGEECVDSPVAEVDPQPQPVEDSTQTETPASKTPACPSQALVDAYHDKLPMLPKCVVLSATRKRAIAARWREVVSDGKFDVAQGVDWFGWFFKHVAESKFLTGRAKPNRDGRSFRADIDWLMNPANFLKVVEGRYHDEGRS